MTDNPLLTQPVQTSDGREACPECGGSGFTIMAGCCGNFTKHGECQGHCAVEAQYQCDYCMGACFAPLTDGDPASAVVEVVLPKGEE